MGVAPLICMNMDLTFSSFKSRLLNAGGMLIIRLPEEVSSIFPSRGLVSATGRLNYVDFEAVLEPDGKGGHWLAVSDELSSRAGVSSGDEVALYITHSKDWPEPPVPADFNTALHDSPETLTAWHDITPLARWDWIRWIRSTENIETRKRRISVMIDKMRKGDRRPCCFNRNQCTVPEVSRRGILDLNAK